MVARAYPTVHEEVTKQGVHAVKIDIAIPELALVVCTTAAQYDDVIVRMRVGKSYGFLNNKQAACTHSYHREDGMMSLVLVENKGENTVKLAPLFAHEAMHVVQTYMRHIAENDPSSEFEAYLMESIYEQLFLMYEKAKYQKPRQVKPQPLKFTFALPYFMISRNAKDHEAVRKYLKVKDADDWSEDKIWVCSYESNGNLAIELCSNLRKKTPESYALVARACTAIKQMVMENIGETSPSNKFEEYVMHSLCHTFMSLIFDRSK